MIKKFLDKINLPIYIRFIFSTYLWGLLFFFIFRFVIFIINLDKAPLLDAGDEFILFIKSFIMGIRFDTVISGYILTLPILTLFIFSLCKVKNNVLNRLVFYFIGVLYTTAFFICSANIPFFNHYFENFTTAAFIWSDSFAFISAMIFQEWTYWIYFLAFVALASTFWFIYNKIFVYYYKRIKFPNSKNKKIYLINFGYFLLFAILVFIGIRGRIDEKSPIRTGTAYFSEYPLPNKLGLNPVFTLINSYILDRKNQNGFLANVDGMAAIKEIQKMLNLTEKSIYGSPIAREVKVEGLPNKMNVVLIIMESMSSEHLNINGETKKLTPFLDSLIKKSYYFSNFYTSGIHTYCGTFSSLFGLPTLFKNHPMNLPAIPYVGGFAAELKPYGYKSLYFTTHDDQFDNAGGFMYGNDFDSVISKSDYPSEKILSTLGVPDHYMFEFSLPILNKISKSGNNFFVSLLTSSNHGPYKIPSDINFKAKNKEITDAIVEYSDWSLNHFFNLAKKTDWYENTIFIFTADHGTLKNAEYDFPLCLTHSPLIVFSPKFENDAKVINNPAGQIDIFSTVMGLLNFPYVNNSLGIDLLKENRKFIFFSADDKIGCLSNEFYLILSNDKEYLYKYKKNDLNNYINDYKSIADSMKNYAVNMMVGSDYLIKTNLIKVDRR